MSVATVVIVVLITGCMSDSERLIDRREFTTEGKSRSNGPSGLRGQCGPCWKLKTVDNRPFHSY